MQRPFEYLIPLPEVIGAALDVGPASKKATAIYTKLLEQFGPELDILRAVPPEDVARCGEPLVAEALSRMRIGAVEILAGYDGEYGTIRIFSSTERERIKGQHALFALPATGPSTAQHVAPVTSVLTGCYPGGGATGTRCLWYARRGAAASGRGGDGAGYRGRRSWVWQNTHPDPTHRLSHPPAWRAE